VDRFEPMPDRELKQQLSVLKNRVATLARSPSGVDAEQTGQAFRQSAFIQIAPHHHKLVLESSFWDILIDGIFLSPFKVFGDCGERFTVTWSQLFQKYQTPSQSTSEWPRPDILSEKWRYVSFEPLRARLLANTQRLPADEEIKKSYKSNVSRVSGALQEALSRVSSHDKRAAISDIVDKACSLALDIGIQRCRLQLFSPRPNDTVSRRYPDTYEDVNEDNDTGMTEGTVKLVVWPGLRKTGDGRGGCLERSIDLSPAGVYLV